MARHAMVRYTGPIKASLRKGSVVCKLVAKFDEIMPFIATQTVAEAEYFGRAYKGLVGA